MRFLRLLSLIVLMCGFMSPSYAGNVRVFETPEAAMEAFGQAVLQRDEAALRSMLGPNFRAVIPTVPEDIYKRFVDGWNQSHKVVRDESYGTAPMARIAVGTDGWTLPLPLMHSEAGWSFDTKTAIAEVRSRMIGRNELMAIKLSLAFYDAQREYAEAPRSSDGLLEYAQKFVSTEGKRDGLYWKSAPGEPQSPISAELGEKVTAAIKKGLGFHGYRYRIITAQGEAATGGAKSYIVNGRMIGGFSLIAWPAKYRETGVMTFMLGHDGVMYQKDLGAKTPTAVMKIETYNPDPSWEKIDVR